MAMGHVFLARGGFRDRDAAAAADRSRLASQRQPAQRRVGEEVVQTDLAPEALSHLGNELGRRQRVTADHEEVVVEDEVAFVVEVR